MKTKVLAVLVVLAAAAVLLYFLLGASPDSSTNQTTTANDIVGENASITGIAAKEPSCNDSLQNQNESGVDCGGPCQACTQVKQAPARNYSANCTLLLDENATITIKGHVVDAKLLKELVFNNTVDYIYLDPSKNNPSNPYFSCQWGSVPLEQVDLYYCSGNYTTVLLNDNKTILNPMLKEFKVGLNVTRVNIKDDKGKDNKTTRLDFKTVNVTCLIL